MPTPDNLRAIVTRPEPAASAFAALLRARGVEAILSPVSEIVFLPVSLRDLEGAALAFTSVNGARAFLALGATPQRQDGSGVAAYVVGEASAAAARQAGFNTVFTASGDVGALAELIVARRPVGELVHLCGRDQAGDLVGALQSAGLKARRVIVYEARAASALSPAAVAALRNPGSNLWVTHFSGRGARRFLDLARDANLLGALRHTGAACLSAAVAQVAGAGWREIVVGRRADAAALIEALLKAR